MAKYITIAIAELTDDQRSVFDLESPDYDNNFWLFN